ncbi:MAG: N-acetyltransferase [Microbacteriaceae bacterium]|nr:N-acetyltransferase [Microbacteriaceae bacterium]
MSNDVLSDSQFNGVVLSHTVKPWGLSIAAHAGDEQVGRMELSPTGRVQDVHVEPSHRRKGIATKMWNYASSMEDETGVAPLHSETRSPEGEAWAQTTSNYFKPMTVQVY